MAIRQSKIEKRLAERKAQKAGMTPGEIAQEKVEKKKETILGPNQYWDGANNYYRTACQAIVNVEGQVADLLDSVQADPEKLSKIKDLTVLTDNVKLLSKDIASYLDNLNTIHDTHKDKKGRARTMDEMTQLLEIHGKYQDQLDIYQMTVIPTVAHILECVGANDIKPAQLTPAQDPSVITDIDFQEVDNKTL